MQAPVKRRKKRGRLYFSSTKALKTSRMGRKKMATERYETDGINKVLDFEETGGNATLSKVDEIEGPSMSRGRGFDSQGPSKDVGTRRITRTILHRRSRVQRRIVKRQA